MQFMYNESIFDQPLDTSFVWGGFEDINWQDNLNHFQVWSCLCSFHAIKNSLFFDWCGCSYSLLVRLEVNGQLRRYDYHADRSFFNSVFKYGGFGSWPRSLHHRPLTGRQEHSPIPRHPFGYPSKRLQHFFNFQWETAGRAQSNRFCLIKPPHCL